MEDNKITSILLIQDLNKTKLIDSNGKDISDKLKFSNEIVSSEICTKIILSNNGLIIKAKKNE
jgi:hypothetical protein